MLTIVAYGLPQPQGSSKAFIPKGWNRAVITSDNAKLKPWRHIVSAAAIEVMGRAGGGVMGPVAVDMYFTLPKPKSAPKQRVTFPDKKPDIDKLCRSTLDALKDAGAIEDDARVVCLVARKVFPHGLGGLPVPGVLIRISTYPQEHPMSATQVAVAPLEQSA